jgi:large conductance mechanosensitive channel
MTMMKEFREFAVKGNVADMAIGIIIGGGFGKIVTSLVNDVVMPPLGLLIGGVNFTGLKLTLKEAHDNAAAVTLNFGSFVQTIVDFTIVAFAMFMVVKVMNALRRSEPVAPAAPSKTETLLAEIRDILKSK